VSGAKPGGAGPVVVVPLLGLSVEVPVDEPLALPGVGLTCGWRLSQLSYWAGGTTLTSARIVACPKPQSSVQTTL
jgi:hypothetical protein